MPAVEVKAVQYSKADLAHAPADERRLFFMVATLMNELNVVTRQLDVLQVGMPNEEIQQLGTIAALGFNSRILAGRLHEGRKLIGKSRDLIDEKYLDAFSEEGAAAYAMIAPKNKAEADIIELVRHKVAFHNDTKVFDKAYAGLSPDEAFQDFYGSSEGISLFYSAETIHLAALGALIGEKDGLKASLVLVEYLQNFVEQFSIFAHSYVCAFCEKFLNNQFLLALKKPGIEFEARHLHELRIDFFVQPSSNSTDGS